MNKKVLLGCVLVSAAFVGFACFDESVNLFGAASIVVVLHALPIAMNYFMSKQAEQYRNQHITQSIG